MTRVRRGRLATEQTQQLAQRASLLYLQILNLPYELHKSLCVESILTLQEFGLYCCN